MAQADERRPSALSKLITLLVEYTPWLNTLQRWSVRAMKLRGVLATNLKRFRLAAGMSQEELAHRADIDRTYVSSLERGRYSASIDMLESLSAALGIEAAQLLVVPPAGCDG